MVERPPRIGFFARYLFQRAAAVEVFHDLIAVEIKKYIQPVSSVVWGYHFFSNRYTILFLFSIFNIYFSYKIVQSPYSS